MCVCNTSFSSQPHPIDSTQAKPVPHVPPISKNTVGVIVSE